MILKEKYNNIKEKEKKIKLKMKIKTTYNKYKINNKMINN